MFQILKNEFSSTLIRAETEISCECCRIYLTETSLPLLNGIWRLIVVAFDFYMIIRFEISLIQFIFRIFLLHRKTIIFLIDLSLISISSSRFIKIFLVHIVYNEFNGECDCSSNFNNASVENILAVNRTCSVWLSTNENRSMNEFATMYRTSYAPFGNRYHQVVPPQQISLVFFLIVTGQKNVRQIKRLMRAIYSPQHYYMIHVDSVCYNYVFILFSYLQIRFLKLHI